MCVCVCVCVCAHVDRGEYIPLSNAKAQQYTRCERPSGTRSHLGLRLVNLMIYLLFTLIHPRACHIDNSTNSYANNIYF